MECAICYEKFFIPKTQEEFERMCEENIKNDEYDDEISKFFNLVITSEYNTTYSCSTPNCDCVICEDCWLNIKYSCNNIHEITEEVNFHFKCPYCRQVDWKDCMNTVLNELQLKVVREEEAVKAIYSRLFPKDFNK